MGVNKTGSNCTVSVTTPSFALVVHVIVHLPQEQCGPACIQRSRNLISSLVVSIPPQVTISRLLQWLKGKSAHHLMAEFPHIKKQFWGRHLWARGYFCCSSGNVTDEVIAKYIAEQNIDQDEDFRVDG